MQQVKEEFDIASLKETILILPSVSIGNIPQLSADLLLHTLEFEKVATLQDKYLYSFVSPVDHPIGKPQPYGVSYALEVFFSSKTGLTLLQQRSPIIPGFEKRHFEEVVKPFVSTIDPVHVLVLDLTDAGLLEQVAAGTIKISTNEDLLSHAFQSLRISKNAAQPILDSHYDHSTQGKEAIAQLQSSRNLVVLESFVYEGDNFGDSRLLADKVAEILNLGIKEWIKPASWLGVYGDKPVALAMEEGLFG